MNIPVTAYLISAFISFESALHVYRLNRLSKLNRLYTALAGSYTVYSIIMIQFFLSPDETSCWFWYRIFTLIACFFLALEVRYFMELAGIKIFARSRIFTAAYYALPLLLALPTITILPVITGFVRMPWGWGLAVKESLWTAVFYSCMMGSNIICTALAIYWRFRVKTPREKKQAVIIILSSLAGTLGLAHLFFPAGYSNAAQALFIHMYYVFCFIVLVFGIRIAIKKYGLMTLVPDNPASELFEGMREALFVLNTRGEILFLNEPARLLARQSDTKAKPGSIFSLFASPVILKHEIDELIRSRESKRPVILAASGKAGGTALETTLLGVKNETGGLIGIIMIVREAGGIPGLQDEHRLTQREIEVLLLLCSGLSSQEIAHECEIALLTAKTHIHNIYQKTGLKNRVELSNLLNKHM